MSEYFTDISAQARLGELPELLALATDKARQLGMAEASLLHLQLFIEELFTNTIEHGYAGDAPDMIDLHLERHATGWQLRYRDHAPAFNPLKIGQKTALTGDVGGLGITLLRGLSRHIDYRRESDANVIHIEF